MANRRIGRSPMRSSNLSALARMFLGLILITLFTGPAVSWADTTVSGNITVDTTWALAGSPFIVTSNITVQGATSAGATLTIEPGVQVRFNASRTMTVGASSGNPGALSAQGTEAAPIVFTSSKATPAAGDWYYIEFDNTTNDATTVLDHCVVEYGGYSQGALYLSSTSPTIRNSTVRYSKNAGIYLTSSSPTLSGNTITANTTYGINIAGTSSPAIAGTVFSDNGNYDVYCSGSSAGTVTGSTINKGIYINSGALADISGNTINYVNTHPIRIGADSVGQLVSANTLNNTDGQSFMEVTTGTITHDATWTATLKYNVLGNITVRGATSAGATLTIEPGVQVRMSQYTQLIIGGSSGNPGALSAQGTAASPIVFTSSKASPAAGDWYYIEFDNTANDATTVLDHCVVEYGGYSQGALNLNSASPTIRNSTVRYSKNAGLYATGSGSNGATISCNIFINNLNGLYVSSALPQIRQNNFNGNTNYGLYFTGSGTLNVENNWWGATTGPNTTGDKTYGNVDADPWSTADHQCGGASQNYPPFAPSAPVPADNAVRIAAEGGVPLGWGCSDPNAQDTLTYAIHLGTTSGGLQLLAQSIAAPSYTTGALLRGKTYFWKVVARDSGGLETAGPVWRFTTAGDPPDFVVSSLTTSPAGGMRANSNVILIAQITNAGNGPVVDGFSTEFKANGTVIGSIASNQILAAGASMPVTRNWTYTGGNPALAVVADSLSAVTETNEANNQLQTSLSVVADITSPTLTGTLPANGAQLQQVQQISASLADTQSAINIASVRASFTLNNSSQQPVAGTASESTGTFTFTPASLPLSDGAYTASLTATDTYGNTQNYSFNFTIDTQPPAKPIITGGNVKSGTVLPRPAQNTADRVVVTLEGTRENNTALWIDDIERTAIGSEPWSIQINLSHGNNSLEIYCLDQAGNTSESEWVDIRLDATTGIVYEYDAAGRLKRIQSED